MPDTFLCANCKKNKYIHLSNEKKKQTRKRAKKDGWRLSGTDKIICPSCADKKFRSQKI